MKQQHTTTMALTRNSSSEYDDENGTNIRLPFLLKNFFERFFSSQAQLTREDWERFEYRRSPQAIRADARRDGIL